MISSRVGEPLKGRLPFWWALGLSVLSCALLVCSFHPVNAGFLAWFALSPWLVMLALSRMRRALYLSFGFGFFFIFFGVNWIQHVGDTYVGLLVIAAILGLLIMLGGYLIKLLYWGTSLPMALIAPAVWVPFEFVRSFIFTGFPWLFLAHTQHAYLPVIQISDVTGAYGVSALLAVFSGLVADLAVCHRVKPRAAKLLDRKAMATVSVVLLLTAATFVYGFVRLAQMKEEMYEGPKLLLVQSNYPMDWKKKGLNRADNYVRLRKLSVAGLKKHPDVDMVVWSETTAPARFLNDPELRYAAELERKRERERRARQPLPPEQEKERRKKLREDREAEVRFNRLVITWMGTFSKENGIHFLTGADTGIKLRGLRGGFAGLRLLSERERDPLVPGEITASDLTQYNSVYFLAPGGKMIDRYDKRHLVPVGEYVPITAFPAIKKTIAGYIYRSAGFLSDLEPGMEPIYFKIRDRRKGKQVAFGNVICFENAFPDLSRQIVARDYNKYAKTVSNFELPADKSVQFIVNESNDGWFYHSAQLDQTVAISVFRAVENRIGFVRCANTGISLFIDPDGSYRSEDVLKDARGKKKEVEGFLARRVKVTDGQLTLYSRYGDFFMVGLILLFLALVAFALRPKVFVDDE